MISWIKQLFFEDRLHINFVIWDNKEEYIVLSCSADEKNPRRHFGGPWRWDTERFKFIPEGILDTLNRLDLPIKEKSQY